MKGLRLSLAARVVVIYIMAYGAWTLLFDRAAAFISGNPAQAAIIESYKGWSFVAMTGMFLLFHLNNVVKPRQMREQNLSDIFENALNGMFQSTLEGRFINVNPAMARMYGYSSPAEMIAAVTDIGLQIHVSAETRKLFADSLLKNGAVENFEAQNYRKDGSVIWTSTHARLVRGENGSPLYFEGFTADVTAHKLTEQALKQSEEKYRLLVNGIGVNEVIFTLDMRGFITYVSPAIERMALYSVEEVIGQPFSRYVHPQDLQGLQASYERTLAGIKEPYEFRVLAKDSSTRHVMTFSQQQTEAGRITGLIGVMADITEHKRAEMATHASEERYRALYHDNPTMFFTLDADAKVIAVNKFGASQLGYTVEELEGGSVFKVFYEADRPAVTEQFKNCLQHPGQAFQWQFRKIRKDGSLLWVEEFARAVIGSDNMPHVLIVCQDISERKRGDVEQEALYQIASAAISAPNLDELYHSIHRVLASIIPAKNFYIALYNEEENLLSFPYFVDEYDEPAPPAPPDHGLTEYVLRTKKPLLASPEVFEELVRAGEVENVGVPSVDWVGVPLTVADKTIGVMVVQTYEEGDRYGQRELEILQFVSSQVAMAIQRKQAEESLTTSEQRYRTLVEQASDGIFISDMDGNYKEVNTSGCAMLGYKPEEILRLNIRDLILPEEIQTQPLRMREIREGKNVISQRRFRRKNGSRFTAEVSSQVLPDGRVLGVIRDITERIRAEEVRLEEQKRFRTLIENSMDGIGLYSADANVIYQSPAVKKILGYEPEELYGTNVAQFVHPDDVERVGEAYQKILEMPPAQTVTTEARIQHKNGSYRWLEIIIGNKLKEPGVDALVANYRDITERKEAERILRESEEQYRHLVEHSPYAVAVHSQGLLAYLNRAGVKLIGAKTAQELYGTPILDFVHPDSRPRVLQRLKELKEGKEASPLEEKFIRRDGSVVDVEVTAYPFVYQNRQAVQVVVRDLTEQKQAQQAIQASEERFSKAFHASPIPTCITTLDHGRFLDVNEAYLKLSDWKREEVIGRTAEELNMYPHGGRADFIKSLLSNEIVQGRQEEFLVSTGEVLDVAAFYELIEVGGQACILSMFYNMTEQNRSREIIRASEERLRAIVNHTQNIYYSHTSDHVLTYMSAQVRNILGYEPEEALIKWQEFLTDHPINQRGIDLTQKAIDTGQPQESYVLELKAKDGNHVWVEVRETPVVRDGKTVAIVGALTDITGRKNAEKKLERHVAELTVLHAVAVAGSQSYTEDDVIERTTQIVNGMLYPENCGVLLLNHDGNTLRSHPSYRGVPQESIIEEFPLSMGITGRVASTGQAIRINDVSGDADYIKTTEGVRSELCVPIRVNEKVIGVFNAESRKINGFDEEDERVLTTIAGALGTAIERIRLFDAEQKRRQQAEDLREATAALTTTIELEKLFEIILDALSNLVPFTSASIEIIENDTAELVAARGLPDKHKFTGKVYPYHSGQWNRDLHKPLIIPDAQADERFEKLEGTEYIRGWMSVPMVAQGMQIAFLNLDSDKVNFFNEEHAALAQTFANQAAIAIKNAYLYRSEKQRYQEAEKLRQAATVVASSLNLKEVLDILLSALKDVVPYDSASILLPEGEHIRIVAAHGLPKPEKAIGSLFPSNNKLLQVILASGQPLILEDAQKDNRFEKWAAADRVRGWMGVPMIARGQVIGFITLDSVSPGSYDAGTAVLAQSFAHQAAVAIENAELFENLRQSNLEISQAYDTTLAGWGKALELRDKETQGHTERVAELTLKLARKLGLGKEELVHIRRGVLVHDIGKMGVSDDILNKKGPLTKKEWAEMRKHPQYAFDLLYPIHYLRPALDVAFYHHERWDGKGYPRGLKGEQIPLSARIFAVVDVWDALLYRRPYRRAWTKKKTIKYIREQSGLHFDPAIVEVFLKMMEEESKK